MYAYFFPFYFSERDSFIKSEGDYQRSKGIVPFFIDEYECDNLKVLNKCDRLYVIAHGNTAVIGGGVRGTKKLEPKDLAKLFSKRSRPKGSVFLIPHWSFMASFI